MADIAGFPYFEVEFDKNGALVRAVSPEQLDTFIGNHSASDLLVISHGWNNDMAEARDLYKRFFAQTREVLDTLPALKTRNFAVLGVLWPSKKFVEQSLIPGGAAGLHSQVDASEIKAQLQGLKGFFDNPQADALLQKAMALVDSLEDKATSRKEFVNLLRSLLPGPDRLDQESPEDFFRIGGDDLMERLSKPVEQDDEEPDGRHGGAPGGVSGSGSTGASGAAGFGNLFGGLLAGARNFLNYTTYYQMKERAGAIGQGGLNLLLTRLKNRFPALKIHLIGHSFGGRLVTATAAGQDVPPAFRPASMTLLQAAFSHFGFARDYDHRQSNGLFRRVMSNSYVSGPVVVTFTGNDTAVGVMYAIASRIKNQVASALGDKNDIYGGMGRNGAQATPEASEGKLLNVGVPYQFEAGKLYNLNADAVINDHSDICKKEVAYALLSAISTT